LNLKKIHKFLNAGNFAKRIKSCHQLLPIIIRITVFIHLCLKKLQTNCWNDIQFVFALKEKKIILRANWSKRKNNYNTTTSGICFFYYPLKIVTFSGNKFVHTLVNFLSRHSHFRSRLHSSLVCLPTEKNDK
jgi:hypothetical protein